MPARRGAPALAWTVRARFRPPALAFLIAALAAAGLVAQQPPITDSRLFQSGIEITSITATVIDKEGHPVTGLGREAFEVYEDGVLQTVTQFTNERVPIGLGVLLDISDSMFGKRMDDARAAVDKFLFELLDPADEFFLMAFNHRPHTLTGWTREQGDVRHALAGLRPSGGTAIYDSILEALPLIDKRTRQRAAILVISDGADTASTATLREVRPALRRNDAFVYAIAIDSPDRQPINTRVNPAAPGRSPPRAAGAPRSCRTRRSSTRRRRGSPRSSTASMRSATPAARRRRPVPQPAGADRRLGRQGPRPRRLRRHLPPVRKRSQY